MADVPATPEPADRRPAADPEQTRQLEELLFECLEARAQGDAARLAQLMPSDPAQAASLRQLLAIADDLHGDQPKQRLGEYDLLHELGGGGMGIVYLARQERLQRLVAIKVIRPEMLASAKMRERFHREARALARVAHPGICPIYDFGEFEGQPFLVMQYLPGKRLSEQAPPTHRGELDVALQQFEQVCEAVQVAHDAGLVHRDLKPQNLVLTAEGRPVVLDFGLARMLTDEQPDQGLTTQNQPVGTPAYMAPERLTGAANATGPGVDIYALGVSLYQRLAGELPFHSPVLEALWSQILRSEASARPLQKRWMPRELLVVVRTAMERDPARRYATAKSFGEDLRRLRLGLPILAQRPSTMTRVVRWTQRNRAVAALLVGLAIAFVVASLLVLGLAVERRYNRSQALAGAASHHQQRNPALQARLALAALDEKDLVGARSELAQSLADWQLQTRLVDRQSHSSMAMVLPKGGIAAIVDERTVVVSRPLGGRSHFPRPDGGSVRSCAIDGEERQLALAGNDGVIWLLDLNGSGQAKIDVTADPITLLQYSPDGSRLVVAADRFVGKGVRRGELHLIDRPTGKSHALGNWTGRGLSLVQFAFTQDSTRLFTVVQGKFVVEHALADGALVREIPIARGPDEVNKTVRIQLVRHEGSLVCGCNTGAIFEIDLATGTRTWIGSHEDEVLALALAPDGGTLASVGNDRTVRLWALGESPGAREGLVFRHPVAVTNVAFEPGGRLLATGANDMAARYWTLRGDMVLELASGLGATNLLAAGDGDVWLASEWNGSGRYRLEAHGKRLLLGDAPVSALLVPANGDTPWTGGADGSLRRWRADQPTPLPQPRGGAIIGIETAGDLVLAIEEYGGAHLHDLSRGTHMSVTAGAGQLRAGWLLAEGREVCLQTTGPAEAGNALWRFRRSVDGAAFERAGEPRLLPMNLGTATLNPQRTALLLPRPGAVDRGGFLVVDLAGDAPPREYSGEPCAQIACSTVDDLVATCMTSHVQLRHGLDDPAPLRLHTDSSGTNHLAFSPDARHLAAISTSGAVWLFDTRDGHLVWRGEVPAIGRCVAFTPDSRYLLTGDSDGVVRHWLVDPKKQRQLAEERLLGWSWDAEDERILRENDIVPQLRR